MAIFDFFKKKKPASAKATAGKKTTALPVEAPLKAERRRAGKEKRVHLAWRVLEQPHISEKATDLTKENKYIFRVFPKSNKKEIKKAVEGIYGVDVLDVRTVSIPRKKKMRGRILGWKKGYKKAIVKIKKGQKIELLPR